MSNQDKPREWTDVVVIIGHDINPEGDRSQYREEVENVHVIEYSAYQKLESELASLRAELARLKDKDHCYCGYCGKQFAVGDVGWRDLQLHINGCEKHPVYQLDVANTKLRKERDELKAENERLKKDLPSDWLDEIDELKAEVEEAKEELTNRSEALANVTSDWLEARREIESLKAELSDVRQHFYAVVEQRNQALKAAKGK